MKRTIIIAASAVTLAAAGVPVRNICPASLRVRSSRWKRHRKSGKKNPKTAARKKEDGSRPAKAATAHRTSSTPIQAAGTTTAYATLLYRFGRYSRREDCRQPRDNIFEINLSRTIPSDARVWLCYELQGADHSGP